MIAYRMAAKVACAVVVFCCFYSSAPAAVGSADIPCTVGDKGRLRAVFSAPGLPASQEPSVSVMTNTGSYPNLILAGHDHEFLFPVECTAWGYVHIAYQTGYNGVINYAVTWEAADDGYLKVLLGLAGIFSAGLIWYAVVDSSG